MDFAAHRESFYKGRVLHRDISAGNTVIYNNRGLLIDWDMSKDFDLEPDSDEKNIFRTVRSISRILDSCAYHLFRYFQGTWAFQSLHLSNRRKKDEPKPVHDRLDDLESFYHVLFWVSLQHSNMHNMGSAQPIFIMKSLGCLTMLSLMATKFIPMPPKTRIWLPLER